MNRVLIVLPSLGRGGAERHAVLIASALDPARWEPHVLAFADGPLRAELTAAGISTTVQDVPRGAKAIPAAAAAIRTAVAELEPELISGHDVLVEAATRLAIRNQEIPNVTWKHTYGHVGHRGLRERLFERATGRAVTRYGAVCHTQVRYLTDELGLPAAKIAVVPNAVAVPPTAQPLPEGPPTVLMAAAMRADKDHALVLRAWPRVLERFPDARLRLAGDGPFRAQLQASGVPNVEFLGLRSDGEALLRDAHLLVLASYAIECFPYAALEAMAAARGVVSTDVGGLPELVDDGVTGRLVPPHDHAALADALIEGLTDATGPLPQWGRAGHARARAVFGLDRWAERIGDLFDELTGSRAAAPAHLYERTAP
jgi:glycosyltransferase involved in cell wall biosynthesis